MSKDKKEPVTLTDEDMVTSPKISRRVLLAGAGVALGGVALSSRSALAGDKDEGEDKDKGDAGSDDGQDKDKADADGDKGDDKDKGDADGDKGDDQDKDDEAEHDSD